VCQRLAADRLPRAARNRLVPHLTVIFEYTRPQLNSTPTQLKSTPTQPDCIYPTLLKAVQRGCSTLFIWLRTERYDVGWRQINGHCNWQCFELLSHCAAFN
jgi:hypothetical protein